jgi:hypothetical protein
MTEKEQLIIRLEKAKKTMISVLEYDTETLEIINQELKKLKKQKPKFDFCLN